ncbi:MAG: hypothetical protein QNJ50_20175 [Mastigocoleus sp. MO_188.B34]|nr:hypothetical protein [Mastigocoleus sp. MO_188.B34]MDJ0696648.1 hypothetical protein [Mastigocoleus sp. MO_188.B34]
MFSCCFTSTAPKALSVEISTGVKPLTTVMFIPSQGYSLSWGFEALTRFGWYPKALLSHHRYYWQGLPHRD